MIGLQPSIFHSQQSLFLPRWTQKHYCHLIIKVICAGHSSSSTPKQETYFFVCHHLTHFPLCDVGNRLNIHLSGVKWWPLTGEVNTYHIHWWISMEGGVIERSKLTFCPQGQGISSRVFLYQQWSKEGTEGTWGMKAGPCSPIQQMDLLKFLKNFMLVLIERCHSTEWITVCCVWGCRADPCPLLKALTLCTQPWTWPQTSAGRWPRLVNPIFFHITWMAGCMDIVHLVKTWHQHVTMERRQVGGGNVILLGNVLLGNIRMLLWHVAFT